MLVDITRQKPFKMGEHILYKGKSTTLSDNTRPMQIQIVTNGNLVTKRKRVKQENKGTMRMRHSPVSMSPIIQCLWKNVLLPPKMRLAYLIANSHSSFVAFLFRPFVLHA